MRYQSILPILLGDLLVAILITFAGFASHHTLSTAGSRFFSTLIPLWVSWVLIAFVFGLYTPAFVSTPSQLWRVALAAIVAAPMMGWLRGFWLNQPIQPIFILVMAGVSVLAFTLWRGILSLWMRRKK
jgi:hypothetical protein